MNSALRRKFSTCIPLRYMWLKSTALR